MNGKDALRKITEEEVEDKMEILKNEVEATRTCLKEARKDVEEAKETLKEAEKALDQANTSLRFAEVNWDKILKKEVADIELPDYPIPYLIPFHKFQHIPIKNPHKQEDWKYDPGPSCRCVSVPIQNQTTISKIGYAIEKIEVGDPVYLVNGFAAKTNV